MEIPKKPTVSISGFKPVNYFKEVRTELTKVDWPTRPQTVRLTSIVIGASVVTAIFLGSFDFLFTKIIESIIK